MPSGRSSKLQALYDLPVGASLALHPSGDDTVTALTRRLKQVTTRYLREGRAYRLETRSDHVVATRVIVGSHKKRSYLTDLGFGERWFAGADLNWNQKKSLLARLDRLSQRHRDGAWVAEIDTYGVWVRRFAHPSSGLFWCELPGVAQSVRLTLRRE